MFKEKKRHRIINDDISPSRKYQKRGRGHNTVSTIHHAAEENKNSNKTFFREVKQQDWVGRRN